MTSLTSSIMTCPISQRTLSIAWDAPAERANQGLLQPSFKETSGPSWLSWKGPWASVSKRRPWMQPVSGRSRKDSKDARPEIVRIQGGVWFSFLANSYKHKWERKPNEERRYRK